jgi:hypothetical protein
MPTKLGAKRLGLPFAARKRKGDEQRAQRKHGQGFASTLLRPSCRGDFRKRSSRVDALPSPEVR